MWLSVSILSMALCFGAVSAFAASDVIPTSEGNLEITRLGHASLMFRFNGKVIHVDPFGKMADYSKLPKADLVLITHEHMDHADPVALDKIRTDKTEVVLPKACSGKIKGGVIMNNGDVKEVAGFGIEAVPAYNIKHMRSAGQPYHPKGRGNGYVIEFGDTRVYVAGDTENIPEMKQLTGIDVAFLPCNLPYTMNAAMVADAAKMFKPKILYPYHHAMGSTDVDKLPDHIKDIEGVELRAAKD